MPSAVCNRARHVAARLTLAALCAGAACQAMAEQFVGLVHPVQEVALSMGVGGVVSRLNVRAGQAVKANQVLMVLDDRMQMLEVNRRQVIWRDNSELDAARDRARTLQSMYQNTKRVFDSTASISRDELARLEVEYSAARGRVEQLVAQKRREKIEYDGAMQERALRDMTAPRAGVITKVAARAGEWTKPGEAQMVLVDASTCYLSTNVPLKAVPGLKTGQAIEVRFEAASGSAPVMGKVALVSSVADPSSGLVEIRIDLPNRALSIRPGIKGFIELPLARR